MPPVSAFAAALLVAAAPTPQPLLTLADPALVESSGLAASTRHRDILWTHADGGTSAQVRAVNRDGRTVAVVTLDGIDPYDPEALAARTAPGGVTELYLGDIGDNLGARPHVSVFRFPEPSTLRDETVPAQWYRFTYPDGPHDAEALLVHPRTGRILIATKELGTGGLYRAPRHLVTQDSGSNRLERVGDVPVLVTDGAFLPDGRFVLRTYSSVFLFDRRGDQVAVDALPTQPQGESLAVDGARLLVGSEGVGSAVYAIAVPTPARSGSARPAGADRDPARPWWDEPRVRVLAVAAAGAAWALAGLRWRRRRVRG